VRLRLEYSCGTFSVLKNVGLDWLKEKIEASHEYWRWLSLLPLKLHRFCLSVNLDVEVVWVCLYQSVLVDLIAVVAVAVA